jgi:hypothetical protein
MSQNKNYSKFSQKKENVNLEEIFPETEAVEADAEQEPIMDHVVEAEAEQAQEIVEESQKVEEAVQTVGFVDNCEHLRVRKESNVDSEELCIISKLSEVVIDLDNSTDYFYKVKTSEGVEGYCMKKFITVK